MPLRRWGALLLVALALLAHTATAASDHEGPTHSAAQHKAFKQYEATLPAMPEEKVEQWRKRCDPLVEVSLDKKIGELKNIYDKKAKAVAVQELIRMEKSEEYIYDATTVENKIKLYDGHDTWRGCDTKPKEAIRVVQFNILSHGLANPRSSGFAAGLKEEISRKDFADKTAALEAIKNEIKAALPPNWTEHTLSRVEAIRRTFQQRIDNAGRKEEEKIKKIYNKGDKYYTDTNGKKNFKHPGLDGLDKKATIEQIREAAASYVHEKVTPLADAERNVSECYATPDVSELLMGISNDDKAATATTGPLKAPMRFNRILSIILEQNPDVITMQELDHHYDFMLPQLQSVGYDGIFQPKHDSKGAEFNGGLADGVAIFWKTKRIEMIKKVPVGWKDSGSLHNAGGNFLPNWKAKSDDKNKKYYPPFHNTKTMETRNVYPGELNGTRAKQVALAAHLRVMATNQEPPKDFLVLTAHVKSGDAAKDLPAKKAQGKEVAGIIAKHNKTKMPVIFACDFNNRPGGDAHKAFFDELKANDTQVTSSYKHVLGEEPKLTTDKNRKGGVQKDKRGITAQTIDYIFYTKEFGCSRVLNIPATRNRGRVECRKCEKVSQTKEMPGTIQPVEKCPSCGGIDLEELPAEEGEIENLHMPGWKYPSDHFMIGADLTFEKKDETRRRMAQREFSNRRDSPVMVRLLQQIIDAQDD